MKSAPAYRGSGLRFKGNPLDSYKNMSSKRSNLCTYDVRYIFTRDFL